jgi:hypothetical protein
MARMLILNYSLMMSIIARSFITGQCYYSVRYIEYGKAGRNALTVGTKNGMVVSMDCSLYEWLSVLWKEIMDDEM